MIFEKYTPSAALAPFIKEYLIIECDEDSSNRTLPDTYMVMGFRFRGRVFRKEEQVTEALPVASISGLRRQSRLFHYTAGTANLLVLFREGGLAAFAKQPAHELFGQSMTSEHLFRASELNILLECFAGAADNKERIKLMERFFTARLTGTMTDGLVLHALQAIRRQGGVVRIKDLAAALHISQDPFEKRFRAAVGATPKQYASIVRLRNIVDHYASFPSLTKASYEAGYFDQSHFIKDFRLFTGQSPKDFLKNTLYW